MLLNTWDDSDIIMSTTVTAAMLKVYLLQQRKVVNFTYACKPCCMEYEPSPNSVGMRIFRFSHVNKSCVHIRYTSNMAKCCDYDVNDDIAPRV